MNPVLKLLEGILPESAFWRIHKNVRSFVHRQPRPLRRLNRIRRNQPHTLLFYPQHPRDTAYNYTINHICTELGILMTSKVDGSFHRAINWQDRPFGIWDDRLAALEELPGLINAQCREVRKRRVAAVFQEAFGYELTIDPTTHHGPCVEKSNDNGQHDGAVCYCPLATPKTTHVYEKLVDNAADAHFVFDYRVPIFKRDIPLVFIKYKPMRDRFGVSTKAELTTAETAFSAREREQILHFCELLGVEYGELDILRDRGDKRLYIVDANNTPTAHYIGYTRKQKRFIIETLAASFEKAFFTAIRPAGRLSPASV